MRPYFVRRPWRERIVDNHPFWTAPDFWLSVSAVGIGLIALLRDFGTRTQVGGFNARLLSISQRVVNTSVQAEGSGIAISQQGTGDITVILGNATTESTSGYDSVQERENGQTTDSTSGS